VTRGGRVGLGITLALAAIALVVPRFAADPHVQPDLVNGALLPPSWTHLLGTDQYSRDVLSRLAHGAATSLQVAVVAVAVSACLGILVGVSAGATTGPASAMLRRVIDLFLSLPRIVVLLVILAAIGTLPPLLFAVVVGATGWPAIARLVRGETLRLRHADYVAAAHALGAPATRVMFREILPGAVVPALVAATLGVADAILLEAGLSYLGLGIPQPAPTWGRMILESRNHLHVAPWLLLVPVAALVAATCAATLLGESLRRSLQPDTR
jgi:peptide/nickel transport system permease protein